MIHKNKYESNFYLHDTVKKLNKLLNRLETVKCFSNTLTKALLARLIVRKNS